MLIRPCRTGRGLTLVELMVGLAVGMLVLVGAMTIMVSLQSTSWRLMVETRLNQDLRAAADVVARDLRRGGYWGNAINGTLAVAATGATQQNPYSLASGSTANGMVYRFSRDATENDVLDAAEQFGFRLNDGVLQMQTASGVWQDLTDSKNLSMTAFTVAPRETALPLGNLCAKVCAAGTPNCPTTTVRSYVIGLTGRAVRDSAMVRSMSLSVRVRNDLLQGQCPA